MGDPENELFEAVQNGDLDKVKQLAMRANINATDSERNTPLMRAILEGHRDIAEFFLLRKAALNISAEIGGTALHFACEKGDSYLIKLLIIAGADLNSRHQDLATPPIFEAEDKGILKILIESGADVDTRDKTGSTALMRAAENGNYDRAKILIENRAERWAMNDEGKTAVMLARENGHEEIVKLIEGMD